MVENARRDAEIAELKAKVVKLRYSNGKNKQQSQYEVSISVEDH